MKSKELNIYEAIKLLDYYVLLINSKEILYITKKENNIVLFNNNIKTTISKNDFLDKFFDCKFLIYKKLQDEIEIDTEYRKLRQ